MIWETAVRLIPPWLMILLAVFSSVETIALAVYLTRHEDQLVLRARDLLALGLSLLFVSIHYVLIAVDPGVNPRGVAMSRISWTILFFTCSVIMTRYLMIIVVTGDRRYDDDGTH